MPKAIIKVEGDKEAVNLLFTKLITWLNKSYKGTIDFEVTPENTKIMLSND